MSSGTVTRAGTTAPVVQVVRYTFPERAAHWVNALSYTYCMVTGLALFTPYMFWMATVLGGGGTIRFWHPWLGLVYLVTIFWMNSQWGPDMAAISEDDQWNKNIENYIKNKDDAMPAQGRFNAGQKMFWKGMLWSTLVLLVTGVVLWIPDMLPHKEWIHFLLTVCVFLHSVAALVTIALFIIHVYMSVWMTPGSMKAMMDGSVSGRWARAHHRLWYEKVTGRKN